MGGRCFAVWFSGRLPIQTGPPAGRQVLSGRRAASESFLARPLATQVLSGSTPTPFGQEQCSLDRGEWTKHERALHRPPNLVSGVAGLTSWGT